MPRTTCPKCGAVLELTDDMVNQQIECGACQAVFVAKPDGPPASRRGDEDRPSRRRVDEEDRPSRRRDPDEDDRPSRRRADDEDERPSRRRPRFEDDEDEDDRPRRRRRRDSDGGQGLAITSLALGVVSVFLALLGLVCCVGFLSIPLSIAGVVCGILGMKQNKGMAIGGIVASGLSLLIYVAVIIFVGAAVALNPGINKQNNAPPFGPQPVNKRPFGK